MNNKSIYGLSLISLGMSMGQVAVAGSKSLKGSLRGAPLVFSIGISISIVIIERVNQAPRAMVTQPNGLMASLADSNQALLKVP